jgi:two-component system, chemotaxis family, sensor kinase CheA
VSSHYDLTPDEADVFFAEANELLESLDSDLVLIEHSNDDELINRIFRAVHTLKGAAGSIGHEPMAHLAHASETVLDKVRKHELGVSSGMVDVLFVVVDSLKQFLNDIVNDQAPSVQVDALVQRVSRLLEVDVEAETEQVNVDLPPLDDAGRAMMQEAVNAEQNIVVIYADADPEGIAPMARLLQVYMQIEQMGCQIISCVPTMEQLEVGEGQQVLVAIAVTDLISSTLQDELEHIADLRSVQVADFTNAADMLFADAGSSVQPESIAWSENTSTAETPVAAAPVESPSAAPGEESSGANGAAGKRQNSNNGGRTVRTSIERLDNLMNLAGELVTDRNRMFKIYEDLSHALTEEQLQVLNDTITHLSTITDQLHDEVVKARMQPIEYVFNKFPRLVRQISQELGKQVELVMSGQDTEVDRSVIEQVSDPLLHLVRNAIDHGIEKVEKRIENGKSPVGRLTLSARSEEGSIIITISDDGRGIDGERVKQKAINMGLITKEQAVGMSYAEAIDMVFLPGLSTAAEVSDLSGRGVGMDVVRSNIQRLNGSVVAYSTPGEGTIFELRLPLTLAIIPTLLVEVRHQVFALPLHNVLEIFKLEADQISTVRRREAVYVRGEILPIFRLASIFGTGKDKLRSANAELDAAKEQNSGEFVVSLNHRDSRYGVVVEKLLGKQDVVIKSLGYPINNVRGLSGATLLGDGRIGLIADIAALVGLAISQEHMTPDHISVEAAEA